MQNPAHCQPAPSGVSFRCSPQRLIPRATLAEEFVMRPSRFLMVMFVLLFLLVSLVSLSPAQTVTIVYSFTGQASSAYPYMASGAVRGRDGMLYGTTQGQQGTYGSIFAVSTSGLSRQLHQFNN